MDKRERVAKALFERQNNVKRFEDLSSMVKDSWFSEADAAIKAYESEEEEVSLVEEVAMALCVLEWNECHMRDNHLVDAKKVLAVLRKNAPERLETLFANEQIIQSNEAIIDACFGPES